MLIIAGFFVDAVDAFVEFFPLLDDTGGDCVVVNTSGFLLLLLLFLLVVADFFCELACSVWISVNDVCSFLAGDEVHAFFFFVTADFGRGGGGLDELDVDFLVDDLDRDRDLFKHCSAHLQLEQSLSAARQTHALFAQVDLDEQVQHESSCFCVVGGTLIPRPVGLKSRIDCLGFTIRPLLRTTSVNWDSGEAEAFFSGVLFLFCFFFRRVGVEGEFDEVMAEAAAAATAAPRATMKACFLQASCWRPISRLVGLTLTLTVLVVVLSSRGCNFPSFVGLIKSTGSLSLPRSVRMEERFERRGGDSGVVDDGDDGMTR